MDLTEKKNRLMATRTEEEFDAVMREILDDFFNQDPKFKEYMEKEVTLEEFLDEVFGIKEDEELEEDEKEEEPKNNIENHG